jgi:hypothetical protein
VAEERGEPKLTCLSHACLEPPLVSSPSLGAPTPCRRPRSAPLPSPANLPPSCAARDGNEMNSTAARPRARVEKRPRNRRWKAASRSIRVESRRRKQLAGQTAYSRGRSPIPRLGAWRSTARPPTARLRAARTRPPPVEVHSDAARTRSSPVEAAPPASMRPSPVEAACASGAVAR